MKKFGLKKLILKIIALMHALFSAENYIFMSRPLSGWDTIIFNINFFKPNFFIIFRFIHFQPIPKNIVA
jgi:hypothetical protein